MNEQEEGLCFVLLAVRTSISSNGHHSLNCPLSPSKPGYGGVYVVAASSLVVYVGLHHA
jgi:hypothetical protein